MNEKGHINFENNLLTFISKNISVNFVSDFQKSTIKSPSISSIQFPLYSSRKHKVFSQVYNRFIFFKKLFFLRNIVKVNDIILIPTFEIFSLALSMFFLRFKKLIIINHNNLDETVNSRFKRFFLASILNNDKVNMIVLNESAFKYSKKAFPRSKLFLINHYLQQNFIYTFNNNLETYNFFAPSNSNDEGFILNLIKLDKDGFFNGKDYSLLIKSKNIYYLSKNLKVINYNFTNDDYYTYLEKCKVVLLPYSSNYLFRTSGVFLEALSFNKQLITSDLKYFRYYSDKYEIVKIFKDFNDFVEILKNIKVNGINSKIIYDFKDLPNIEQFVQKLIDIL